MPVNVFQQSLSLEEQSETEHELGLFWKKQAQEQLHKNSFVS